ncbi:MAG: PadR family transcriptional regulator [Candidatus Kapaibacterium sp.]|nr:MAG: PadR family transcriptional regulator [Candidatus Kapabacteria bacterium]
MPNTTSPQQSEEIQETSLSLYLEKWSSQVRKGSLELLLLLFMQKKEYYGYELIENVKTILMANVSEGTLYPLLNRMQKDGLISSQWRTMGVGIPRKYYTISPLGKKALETMKQEWLTMSIAIQKLSL